MTEWWEGTEMQEGKKGKGKGGGKGKGQWQGRSQRSRSPRRDGDETAIYEGVVRSRIPQAS